MGIFEVVKRSAANVYTAGKELIGPHKTDLYFAGGMLMLGAGIFAMCKASTKLPEKTANLEKSINNIATAEKDNKITPEQAKIDIRNTKVKAGAGIAKDYILGAALVTAGVAFVSKSYLDVKDDNAKLEKTVAGLAVAYNRLQNFTNTYRGRVVAEEGAEKDTHYAYGTMPIEVTKTATGADGKPVTTTETIQVVPNDDDIANDLGQICIYPSNPLWKDDPGMLLTFIKNRFVDAESMLYHSLDGKITRNTVCDLFAVHGDFSERGMRAGFIFDKNNPGKQLDYAVHWVSREKGVQTKYIPQGGKDFERYVIIELKNLNPDIRVPRYRFQ